MFYLFLSKPFFQNFYEISLFIYYQNSFSNCTLHLQLKDSYLQRKGTATCNITEKASFMHKDSVLIKAANFLSEDLFHQDFHEISLFIHY